MSASLSDWPNKNPVTAGLLALGITLASGVAASILTAQNEAEHIAEQSVEAHAKAPAHPYAMKRLEQLDRRLADMESDRGAIFVLLERLHEDVKQIRKDLKDK